MYIYVFNYNILRHLANYDVTADSASTRLQARIAASVHVAFKTAISTKNIEMSATDHSRPYRIT